MKLLNGRELADYIKARQIHQVRALRQAHKVLPCLAIVQTTDNPVIDKYVSLKQQYGADILVDVHVYKIKQNQLLETIEKLNNDSLIHGIIVQLPLSNPSETLTAVNTVVAEKDVDGLGVNSSYDPATPIAINWLLAGYNVNLAGKKIAIVGNGRLVGSPLSQMWINSGYDVTVFDETSGDLHNKLTEYDLIVSATGTAGLIASTDIKQGAVVVDAGTSSEHGKIVGDVDDNVRQREDLTITPKVGGVGPLTVAALFENLIHAANMSKNK